MPYLVMIALLMPSLGGNSAPILELTGRDVIQLKAEWSIRYQLVYRGSHPLKLDSEDILVRCTGWLSNSRCEDHGLPILCDHNIRLDDGSVRFRHLQGSVRGPDRCREWIGISLSKGSEPLQKPPRNRLSFLPFSLEPGDRFWVYLSLRHDHAQHVHCPPLLGDRSIKMTLGQFHFQDELKLGDATSTDSPDKPLSSPPADRLDNSQFHSAPHSLHLTTNGQGRQYFRFDDVPVKHNSPITVSFWYLMARGSDGVLRMRVMEYFDTDEKWVELNKGAMSKSFDHHGEWVRVDYSFSTSLKSTSVAVDFKLTDAKQAELWIDDVELRPAYGRESAP